MASAYDGYMGKVMQVNLTDETVCEYPWSDAERVQYLGGKPMAYKILSDCLTGTESAFSEENPIVISTGPLALCGVPASSRYDITTVSPFTQTPVSSNFGGEFGLWLKRAGYDALILVGRCETPRWLEIRDGDFVFHDAADLWGSYTDECQTRLSVRMDGQKYGSLCIGPAGENAVSFASVMDGTHTSGRTGMGGVFGWKKLKAVVVYGTKQPPIRNTVQTARLNKKWAQNLHTHPLTGQNSRSGTPLSKPCFGCPVLCRRQFTKGANALTDQFNRLGMDSVSALDAVAWGEAAAAQGIFTQPLPPREQLYIDMAFRRGAGAELADGVKELARKYNFKLPKKKGIPESHNRSDEYRILLQSWGLVRDELSDELWLDAMLLYLDLSEALSASGLCMFTVNAFCPPILLTKPNALYCKWIRGIVKDHAEHFLHRTVRDPEWLHMQLPLFWYTKTLYAVSGVKLSPGQFLKIGARCFALEQLLTLRFGGDPEKLPKMLAKEKICTPGTYFAARGWNARGIPPDL